MTLASILEQRINPERSRNFSADRFASSLAGLERLAREIEIIDSEKSVHVVGTNGKGSTSWFLSEILSTRGRTGLYTSPHLLHFTERIRIDHLPAPEEELLSLYNALADQNDLSSLTYFELLTVLAGAFFAKKGTTHRVYEAGLGGRLDATRIFRGAFVVLTQIDLDHTNILGATPREILFEKMGICTESTRLLITLRQKHFSFDEIRRSAPCDVAAFEGRLEDFPTYLEYNQAFARFCAEAVAPGVVCPELTPMPGRLEVRKCAGKTLIFDHAHNPAAIAEVLRSVRRMHGCPERVLAAIGVLHDRSVDDCMAAASGPGIRVVPITSEFFHSERGGIPLENLQSLLTEREAWIVFLGSHRLYSAFLDTCYDSP